eukprot:TRINITY_DN6629_c0_g1::TRINITY_DN6629_c0_g1_i1::g.20336::m.20336 TRINITY_DN6629_c0_g1::TRINITY_DN6629_c0_g1_i1::g.20336  ORF type:complete len:161 (-),score=34.83,sp/O13995/DAP1_SCHPO/38.41/4e-23,Cyt-b5/PF00173.23/9.8e-10 TRINITY_DN6629_c0_g1_i1:184-666(-)
MESAYLLPTIIVGFTILLLGYMLFPKTSRKEQPASTKSPVADLAPIFNSVEKRDYTLEELRKYDGRDGRPILIALKGIVHNCTYGAPFYGPGCSYHVFAGKDATRCMALTSTDEKDSFNHSLDDLQAEHFEALEHWVGFFRTKYPIVGKIIDSPFLKDSQ